jgi:GMP synthase (glutamine-hydrolysing)
LEKILFGQGTLRPDVIESGDKRATMGGAHEIKLHHNMGFEDIPRLEPFTDLFKENVRRMAVRFDLGEEIAFRQPFPGPGLYVRTVCMKEFSVDNEYNNLDRRVYELGKKRDLNVHVLPMRTVGVQGDERTVKHSAIVSGDIDWEECFEFVDELPNIERGVNRVLYFPGKPLSFDEVASITPTTMTRDVIAQAQEADFVMREIANDYGFNDARRCSQFPCSLTACSLGEEGKRMVVGRPFLTPHFMAGIAQRPESIKQLGDNPLEFYPDEMYERMAKEIPERVEGIVGFAMDGAHKPPATTEME